MSASASAARRPRKATEKKAWKREPEEYHEATDAFWARL